MYGTFFSQKEKTIDGLLTFRGEDAVPYADDRFLLVADGLGGMGFGHRAINMDIFDPCFRYDTLFKNVFQENPDQFIRDYVNESFFDMENIREFYHRNSHIVKSGGYFASRFVSAILLGLFMNDQQFNYQKLFSVFTQLPPDKQKIYLDELSDALSDSLRTKLTTVCKNGHFTRNETNNKRLCLMPTTLSTALYSETEQYVDIILIWAGDSRIYAFSKNGLQQLTRDDEDAELMNNFIQLDGPFYLNCRSVRLEKPFVLLGMSDGCFDNIPRLLTFECYAIINAFLKPHAQKINEYWKNLFGKYSDDDSATIAYKVFGIDTYTDLSAFVRTRMEFIKNNYLTVVPDLLTYDAISEYQKAFHDQRNLLNGFSDRFWAEHNVVMYCEQEVEKNKPANYINELTQLTQIQHDQQLQIETIQNNMTTLIQEHWHEFCCIHRERKYQQLKSRRKFLSKCTILQKKLNDCKRIIFKKANHCLDTVSLSTNNISLLLKSMTNNAVDVNSLEADKLLSHFGDILMLLSKTLDDTDTIIINYHKLESRLAKRSYKQFLIDSKYTDTKEHVDALISGIIAPPKTESAAFIKFHTLYKESEKCKAEHENTLQSIGMLRNKFAKEYFREYLPDIVFHFIYEQDGSIPQELYNDVVDVVSKSQNSLRELKDKADHQKTIEQEYEQSYYQYIPTVLEK